MQPPPPHDFRSTVRWAGGSRSVPVNCPSCGKVLDPAQRAVFGRPESESGMVICTCGASASVRKVEADAPSAPQFDIGKVYGSRQELL